MRDIFDEVTEIVIRQVVICDSQEKKRLTGGSYWLVRVLVVFHDLQLVNPRIVLQLEHR